MKKIPFLLLFFCALHGLLSAAEKPLHLSVLAIGNSYTGNAALLPQWVKGSGKEHTLSLKRNTIGGATLEDHWQSVVMLEGGEPAKHGKTASLSQPLVAALNAQNWDYVSIQHAFPQTADLDTYEPYLGKLVGLVKKYAPEAKPFFYQTWVYREDNKFYKNANLDREAVKKAVVEAGNLAAQKYGMPVLPAGEALFRAEAVFPFVRDPAFDYDNPPTAGEGPHGEKSLYRSWTPWRGIMLNDNVHMGLVGSYIIAGVWYAMLYDENAVGNAFIPEGMTKDQALICQQIIDEVTAGRHFPPPAPKTQDKPRQDFSRQQAILAQIKAEDVAPTVPPATR